MDKSDKLAVRAVTYLVIGWIVSSIVSVIVLNFGHQQIISMINAHYYSSINYSIPKLIAPIISFLGNIACTVFLWKSRQERVSMLNTIGLLLSLGVTVTSLVGIINLIIILQASLRSFQNSPFH